MRISDWSSDVCSSDLAELAQRLDVALAQAVHVHRTAAGEVEYRLRTLRRAREFTGATRDRLALLAHDVRAADRALRGHRPRRRVRRAHPGHHGDDFGNHVPRAADNDGV